MGPLKAFVAILAVWSGVVSCDSPSGPPTTGASEILSSLVLGKLPGDGAGLASAINERGDVVGVSWRGVDGQVRSRAFLWSLETGMVDLGEGEARDVSEGRDVVGIDARRAVLWERIGSVWSFVTLPPFEEPLESGLFNDAANAISPSADRIVGQSSPDMGQLGGIPVICQVPVVWTRTSGGWGMHLLPTADSGAGTCEGHGSGLALNVNRAGSIVGASPTLGGSARAVVWVGEPGAYVLETLPAGGAPISVALGIHEDGTIVGVLQGAGSIVAVRWTRDVSAWVVDTIGPGTARAVSATGLVVGTDFRGVAEAWFWTPAGGLRALGPGDARDVNDAHQVVGQDGMGEAVVWQVSRP